MGNDRPASPFTLITIQGACAFSPDAIQAGGTPNKSKHVAEPDFPFEFLCVCVCLSLSLSLSLSLPPSLSLPGSCFLALHSELEGTS